MFNGLFAGISALLMYLEKARMLATCERRSLLTLSPYQKQGEGCSISGVREAR